MLCRTSEASSNVSDFEFPDIYGSTECPVDCFTAVFLQKIVQCLYIIRPAAWSTMNNLGKKVDRGFPGVEEMLALEVALATFPRNRGEMCSPVLGQRRSLLALEYSRMCCFIATSHNADPISIEVERTG